MARKKKDATPPAKNQPRRETEHIEPKPANPRKVQEPTRARPKRNGVGGKGARG